MSEIIIFFIKILFDKNISKKYFCHQKIEIFLKKIERPVEKDIYKNFEINYLKDCENYDAI